MSLIFEALKKLERDRDTAERGFQVIAHTPWPARSRAVRVALMAVAAGALAGAGAWGAWTWLSASQRRPATTGGPVVRPAAAARMSGTPLPPPIWESAPAPARPAAAAAPAAPRATPAPAATPDEPPLLVIAPRGAAPEAAAPLRLEAISAQDGEPVAVINGQLVRKGDTVEGALVVWIGADAVEVEIDGKRRALTF